MFIRLLIKVHKYISTVKQSIGLTKALPGRLEDNTHLVGLEGHSLLGVAEASLVTLAEIEKRIASIDLQKEISSL